MSDDATSVTPETSSWFVRRTDRENGIDSYLLAADLLGLGPTEMIGSALPSATVDGRLYWIATDADDRTWTLTAIAPPSGTIRRVTSIDRGAPTPTVDPATGTAYVVAGSSLVEYTPRTDGDDVRIDRTRTIDDPLLTDAVAGLSRSADGDRIAFVADTDGEYRIASVYLPEREVNVWHSTPASCTTVRFSPTDPTLLLFARATSVPLHSPDRSETADAWLAREGLGSRPLGSHLPERHRGYWWAPDGSGLRYVDPGSGVRYLDLELGRRRTVWEGPARAAHATRDGGLIAATVVTGERTGLRVTDGTREVDVVSPRSGDRSWRPCPSVLAGDSYLGYTAVVEDRPTFAVAPLSELRRSL